MILITDGLGFIGSNIINSLNEKFVIIETKNISLKSNILITQKKLLKYMIGKN